MPFKILENEATADIAILVKGKNLSEIFSQSAMALFSTMADTKTVAKKIRKQIKLEDISFGNLLVKFLEEIVYIKDKENMLFSGAKVSLKKSTDIKLRTIILNAVIIGDKINAKRQKIKCDVKAITLHMFELKQKKDKTWQAKFVLDI